LVVLGFLTTGARLLLTHAPSDVAVYSFIGFPVSKVLGLLPLDWRLAYPYLWYLHAILGAVFIAYLPFGKLKHIFNVPLTYLIEELTGVKKEKRV
jgi:nitrate reductase gamma subunit